MFNPLPPPTTNARGGLIIVMAFTVVLGNIVAATPAHAADTYAGSRTCVSTKTPQSYTPLASSSGADYILHTWTGSGGWVSRNWTTTKVWSRTTGYISAVLARFPHRQVPTECSPTRPHR